MIADLHGDGFSPDSPDQVGPMLKQLIDSRDGNQWHAYREDGRRQLWRALPALWPKYHAFDNPEAGIDPNARLAIHSRLHSTPTDC